MRQHGLPPASAAAVQRYVQQAYQPREVRPGAPRTDPISNFIYFLNFLRLLTLTPPLSCQDRATVDDASLLAELPVRVRAAAIANSALCCASRGRELSAPHSLSYSRLTHALAVAGEAALRAAFKGASAASFEWLAGRMAPRTVAPSHVRGPFVTVNHNTHAPTNSTRAPSICAWRAALAASCWSPRAARCGSPRQARAPAAARRLLLS